MKWMLSLVAVMLLVGCASVPTMGPFTYGAKELKAGSFIENVGAIGDALLLYKAMQYADDHIGQGNDESKPQLLNSGRYWIIEGDNNDVTIYEGRESGNR